MKHHGKWALALLLLLIAGVMGKHMLQQPKKYPDTGERITPTEIEQMLTAYNSHLPARVDEFTILERVTFESGNVLQYHYAVSGTEGGHEESAILERIQIRHVEQYCASQETAPLRDKGIAIVQMYYRDRMLLGTAIARPEDCH